MSPSAKFFAYWVIRTDIEVHRANFYCYYCPFSVVGKLFLLFLFGEFPQHKKKDFWFIEWVSGYSGPLFPVLHSHLEKSGGGATFLKNYKDK